jgi:hypothetical protein
VKILSRRSKLSSLSMQKYVKTQTLGVELFELHSSDDKTVEGV